LLFRAPVAKVVELAVETACLQYSAEVQGAWFTTVDEAGRPMPVDPDELVRYAAANRAAGRVRSPNLWWPDDRAWVVGTDIDGNDTIVAGSHDAIDAILAHPDLDATRTSADDQLTERT
jgi:hypothetical protein